MNYALLCVGSSFTVGVAAEKYDTTSVTEMVAAPERAHIMAATAGLVCKMAVSTTPRHVTTAILESNQVTADLHESSQVTANLLKSSQVSADLPVTSCLSCSSRVTLGLSYSSRVTSHHS